MRAGVSFANALAYALARPVYPVTAFELIGFEAWRKVQADRAELDLWTEATTSDE